MAKTTRSGKLKLKAKVRPAFGKDRVSKVAADISASRPKRGFAHVVANTRRDEVVARSGKGGTTAHGSGHKIHAARSGKLKVSKTVKAAVRKKK